MKDLSLSELQSRLVLCEGKPPRTTALEQEIKIGTGFHNKWYRSQKEHWVAWTQYKIYKAIVNGKNPDEVSAKTVWNKLKCLPMMFWLAEVAGCKDQLLTAAEKTSKIAVKIKSHDCAEHGGAMRKVIRWEGLNPVLYDLPGAGKEETHQVTAVAYDRLMLKGKKSAEYRKVFEESHRI